MSTFRITYCQDDEDGQASENIEAADFVRRGQWIVFLDAAAPCHSVRSDDVVRIERIQAPRPVDEPPPLPSDFALPR